MDDQTNTTPEPQKQRGGTKKLLLDSFLGSLPPRAYKTTAGRLICHVSQVMGAGESDVSGSTKNLLLTLAKKPISFSNALRLCAIASSEIDDRLDPMPPESIVAMGEASLGTTPSEFLQHPELFSADDHKAAQLMLKTGVITHEEGVAFGNLASHLVSEEAKAAVAFRDNPTIENRYKITEAHMQLSVLCGAAIHFIMDQTPAIKRCIREKHTLTFEDIVDVYPALDTTLRAVQMQDEALDLVTDLREEITTGRPSPNWFLSRLHERGQLYDDKGAVLPYLQHFCRWTDTPGPKPKWKDYLKANSPENFIPLAEMPRPLEDTLRDGTHKLEKDIRTLPEGIRSITWVHFLKTLEGGCLRYPLQSDYLRSGGEAPQRRS